MLDAVDEDINAGLYPTRALSLKGPWWWFMLHLPEPFRKPIENRPTGFSHKSFRGECWVHATKPSRFEYDEAMSFARAFNRVPEEHLANVPSFDALPSGGIVGRWNITGVLPAPYLCALPDGWRMAGCFAFTVADARPVPWIECKGALGFWRVPHDVLRKLAGAK